MIADIIQSVRKTNHIEFRMQGIWTGCNLRLLSLLWHCLSSPLSISLLSHHSQQINILWELGQARHPLLIWHKHQFWSVVAQYTNHRWQNGPRSRSPLPVSCFHHDRLSLSRASIKDNGNVPCKFPATAIRWFSANFRFNNLYLLLVYQWNVLLHVTVMNKTIALLFKVGVGWSEFVYLS